MIGIADTALVVIIIIIVINNVIIIVILLCECLEKWIETALKPQRDPPKVYN